VGARRAVFFDRDGVLNDVVHDGDVVRGPVVAADLRVATGAPEAVAAVRAAGFLAIVVSNQPDVARGRTTAGDVEAVHAALRLQVEVDDVLWCPHDGREGCACRKPLPGMMLEAAERHDLDLAASWLVGDRWVDLAAARAAGVAPVLLERPWSWAPTGSGVPPADLVPLYASGSLTSCVERIVAAAAHADPTPTPPGGHG
jgi:D-glycero-D-manno-heptose 1,7-bisphosphate phosphatase